MKLPNAIIALALGLTTTTNAWSTSISSSTSFSTSFPTSLAMASRKAEKIASRSKWAESHGVADSSNDSAALCTVVGGGRIGSLLQSANPDQTLLLKRGDSIPSDASQEGTPIYLATRNDSLQDIVDNCPSNRRQDLVFLQNGYLDNFLSKNDLLDNTQALLFLSVPALGVEAVDGITSVNPEGLTAITGVHGVAFQELLKGLDLKCNVVSAAEYRPAMFEKLIWISTYMLVGTAKECKSVGQAQTDHSDLVQAVIQELLDAVSAAEDNLSFQSGSIERLAAYTDVVADFPCGVKEFEWRNEYFYNLKNENGEEACPTHNGLLRECKEKGFLGFDLP